MTLQETYENFVDFEILSIEGGDTGPIPDPPSIEFEYTNPSVGIDTGGNFVKHEIIGGTTVRQKIGSQPMEISIQGIAYEDTAHDLELLRNARQATLLSDRFAKDSVTVHIVSVTTDPMTDGGAADYEDGEFLYTYSLECVELYDTGE